MKRKKARERWVKGWFVASERMNGDLFCANFELLAYTVKRVAGALEPNETLTVTASKVRENSLGNEIDAGEMLK